MRKNFTIPDELNDLLSFTAKKFNYMESPLICFCINYTLTQLNLNNIPDFLKCFEKYYRYHITKLPRGKKSRSK